MATHSSILAWKIPWMEEPGRLQSIGSLGVGHDWVTSLSFIGEGNGNPLQYSCLENPRDGEAWWAAVYGVAQSWTRLKWLSSSSSKLHSEKCLLNREIQSHFFQKEKKAQTKYFIVSVINANKLIQTKLGFSKLYIHKYHFFYYNIQLFFSHKAFHDFYLLHPMFLYTFKKKCLLDLQLVLLMQG